MARLSAIVGVGLPVFKVTVIDMVRYALLTHPTILRIHDE
jgi:hypothetical protein